MKQEEALHVFNPLPLGDEWSNWFVGTWEGTGISNTGQGKGRLHVETDLSSQFLICRGEATITHMDEEAQEYLKRNMHASDEEIERFKTSGYQSLELYTTDPGSGEVLAYLFDNLRCIATGRGTREGNTETVYWEWSSGHKSTRITERAGTNRVVMTERTPMPDGSVMEDRGEMLRVSN